MPERDDVREMTADGREMVLGRDGIRERWYQREMMSER